MSSSIFIKGGPYNSSLSYYLAYTSSNTKAYVFSMNTGNYSSNGLTPVAGFLELTDGYKDYSIVEFIVTLLGNNTYSLQSGNYYLGLNSNGILDLVSNSGEVLLFGSPSNSTMNIYDLQNVLYPGIPYSVSSNGSNCKWYIFTPTTTSSWEYYTITNNSNVTPFLLQVNTSNNPLAVWQTNEDYPNGHCFYSSNNDSIGVKWLYDWTKGTSTNCDKVGPLDGTYNNCYFNDLLSCEISYSYNFCTGVDTCGKCMGTTSLPSSLQCRNNLPGYNPILIESSTEVDYIPSEAVENSSELDEDNEDNTCATGLAIFLLFVIIVAFLGFILVIIIKSHESKKTSNIKKT